MDKQNEHQLIERIVGNRIETNKRELGIDSYRKYSIELDAVADCIKRITRDSLNPNQPCGGKTTKQKGFTL